MISKPTPHPARVALVLAALVAFGSSAFAAAAIPEGPAPAGLHLNELEYLEMPGLNVMLAHDYYPEGHQGGVGIIQNGQRVATNGDLRLDRTPGQWQPVPKVGKRVVDKATGEISLRAEYPDEAKNRKGFNPVDYPDLAFAYTVRVRPEGQAFRILVDLEQPLPDEWIGKVGFNMELFPGILFGKTFATETTTGIFPRQADGPGGLDTKGEYQIAPLATGKRLVIAPESERQRLAIEDVKGGGLELVDGRGQHNNGWFVVRSLVPKGATTGAVEWRVTPHAIPGFTAEPTVQVSQVGYHPKQQKWALVETDPRDTRRLPVIVSRITGTGVLETAMQASPQDWGRFLRYDYLRLDFTSVETPGMYVVSYGAARSNPFRIGADVYQRHVWQPTVDSFLPIQMCHVRVNERYRVWHDACHLDDARMAPVDHNHFDGYLQGPSTLTKYAPGEPVPGLDRGGWHDAGDDDLRVESQADTMHGLALAWEAFHPDYDDTTVDQKLRVVEMHQPDGKPDVLQQIEHGALTVVGGYRALGRFYRGIISPTLRQYTHLGDFAAQTDNVVYDPKTAPADAPPVGTGVPGSPDDRWVFTEQNPRRELGAAAGLAASARASS
jgi:endoglucanase